MGFGGTLDHGEDDILDSGLAEPRCDAKDVEDVLGKQEGNGEHADGCGCQEDENARRQNDDDGSLLDSEYRPVSVEDSRSEEAKFLEASFEWVGALPDPASMKAYPEEVQKAILQVFLNNASMKNELTRSAIKRDEEESKRQDLIVTDGLKQSKASLVMSFAANIALIAAATVLGLNGADGWVVGSVIGGLAAINVIPPIFKNRKHEEKADKSNQNDGDEPSKD